ncbi:hypothetical protein SDC9_167788 [bioreactor metagenome]|uniref:Uncharacterized protein n=1 Tax=bioreactor metagenome TaxID=1076179 RepID=A0A645G3M1_9ZZZZ
MKLDPAFEGNKDFGRDIVNVIVGIVWQMALVVLPIFFIIHKTGATLIALGVVVICMVILKYNWYDKLHRADIGFENVN